MKSVTPIVLAFALAVPGSVSAWQTKAATPAAKAAPAPKPTPAESLDALVSQNKTAEAVRLSTRNPAIVLPFLKSRMEQIDLQVTDRKIEEARASSVAIDAFANAYVKASKRKDIPVAAIQGRALRIEGIILGDQKQYAKSEEALKKALELAISSGDKTLEAGIHNNLGYAIRFQQVPGKDDKILAAVEEYETARKIAEEQKDSLRASSYNFNLGMVLLTVRKFEPALLAFKRSTDQAREAARPSYEARGVLYQGIALSRINLAGKEPLNYFNGAAKLFEKLGDMRNTGWSYWLAAEQTAYGGDFKDAARCAEIAVSYLSKGGDKPGLLRAYEFLADMYSRFKDEDSKAKRERYLKLAEEIQKETAK
jgi:tetratricopeptide (TPR) repeat protein